jgi:hypothetical protein
MCSARVGRPQEAQPRATIANETGPTQLTQRKPSRRAIFWTRQKLAVGEDSSFWLRSQPARPALAPHQHTHRHYNANIKATHEPSLTEFAGRLSRELRGVKSDWAALLFGSVVSHFLIVKAPCGSQFSCSARSSP